LVGIRDIFVDPEASFFNPGDCKVFLLTEKLKAVCYSLLDEINYGFKHFKFSTAIEKLFFI